MVFVRPQLCQRAIWADDGSATELVGAADFPLYVDQNGNPDFVLFTPDTLEAGIWYLDNNLGLEAAHYGPTSSVRLEFDHPVSCSRGRI